ncbi:hypothetical protein MGYG_06556 [Nannizzia gypsea CBS 118893]|uniref:Uncharacterized protein n=1 Tax=Arthroderma gypseum (strain ATCC MYA-4604 / CBS 118893) TaxID=535722 RepID=E4UZN0_ARTGP|nr:hypothetical protein MGYG_06556 [Nannizzia gypsea CBS 118893]EFR03560.1 hypothetical protein MGYG_06556 [Nannizzia gypsea CBS 118893]
MAVGAQAHLRVLKQPAVVNRLITYLQPAVQRATRSDILIIPLSIINDILQTTPALHMDDLSTLVQILGEPQKRRHCSRLDIVSFQCILFLFLHAPACVQREKGLYLLLDAMIELSDVLRQDLSQEAMLTALRRKATLCQKTCIQLVHCFTRGNYSMPRKWAGQFILELILEFDKNKHFLICMPEGVRGILDVLFKDNDQCLQIIAAAIMKEVASCESRFSELSGIDNRIELLKRSPGFLLPTWSFQWAKEVMKIISHYVTPHPGAFCALVVSIEGLAEYVTSADFSFLTVSQNGLAVLIMHISRFNLIEIPLAWIESVQARRDELIVLLRHGYYSTMNGVQLHLNNISIRMEAPHDVEAAIKAVKDIKGRNIDYDDGISLHDTKKYISSGLPVSDNGSPQYNGPNERAVAVIAFQGCMNEFEHGSPGSHASIRQGSDYDVCSTRWQETHRPPSSAILELPTGEEVLSASQLCLQPRGTQNSQIHHQQPHKQHDSKLIGNTPATRDLHPTNQARKLNTCLHSLERRPQQVIVQARGDRVEVLQTSPNSSSSANSTVAKVGEVDRAAGLLRDLPNLANPTLLPQRQLLDSNLQTAEKQALSTSCVEETTCWKPASGAEKTVTIIPDSQPEIDLLDTMTPFKPPQETRKPKGESNSTNNSRLKRPAHKLCGSSTKKADLDWEEGLRVKPETPQPQAETAASAKNAKSILQDIDEAGISKSMNKPNRGTKRNVRTQKSTPHAGNALATQDKSSHQVAKTMASARQPRNAADTANKKIALATEQENVIYELDDPIESSYSASISLEDLAEHFQANDQSMRKPQLSPPDVCARAPTIPFNNGSIDPSGGVPPPYSKHTVPKQISLCMAPEAAVQQVTQSQKSEPTKPDSRREPVIDLCSDNPQNMGIDQTRRSTANPKSMMKLSERIAGDIPQGASEGTEPQSIAKELATTLASGGLPPAMEGQKIKRSDRKECKGPEPEPQDQRKFSIGNGCLVSTNVSQFMSRNQPTAHQPILTSTSRNPDQKRSNDLKISNSKSNDTNAGKLFMPVGNQPTEAMLTKMNPTVPKACEQQKPPRSVKFDLDSYSHTPSIESSDNAITPPGPAGVDEKAVFLAASESADTSPPLGLRDNHAPSAPVSGEGEIKQPASCAMNERPKYTSVRKKQIGWQFRTVDEKGSPIPRLQMNKHNCDHYTLEMSRPEHHIEPAHVRMPPLSSGRTQLQGKSAINSPAYRHMEKSSKQGIADGDSFQPSNMFEPRERHSDRRVPMKKNDIFYDNEVPSEKLGHQAKPATSTQDNTVELIRRLNFYQAKRIPQHVDRERPSIDARGSTQFNTIYQEEHGVNVEVETDDECLPQLWRQKLTQPVEPRDLRGMKQISDNNEGNVDLLLNTSKYLSHELWQTENRLYNSVDIYRVGCTRMLGQLEDLYSEKLGQSEHALRPIKRRFLGMFDKMRALQR